MGDIAFEALAAPPRLRVADTVGNEQYTLHLDSPVAPEPVPTDGFTYPVSDAVRVEMAGFELQQSTLTHLWNREGELRRVGALDDGFDVRGGDYSLELCGPLKTYVSFTGGVTVRMDGDGERVEFEEPTVVEIGARSPRKQPAHSITTTGAPVDLMRALSQLGEGLLTTTPMRAYPSLRGYPPEFEIGDTLDIPDGIETGPQFVTLELPPVLEYLYEAAPLAYYLDADIQPGEDPRVLLDGDAIHSFDRATFADDVETLLRHVFTIDCVVRTAGPYPISSVVCERLEDAIPFELDSLFSADPATRLRKYLDVPFEPVAEQFPGWLATTYVEPEVENLVAIPHVVAQLTPIRTVSPERLSGTEARRVALAAFTAGEARTRAATEVFDGEASFVDVGSNTEGVDVWVGDDVPISADKLLVEGFRNRFRMRASEERTIDVTIICNEGWMSDEATAVQRYYDEQGDLPYDVTIHERLDRASLAELIGTETDFLHYVGHATSSGLECRDGYLDVSTVPSVGIETFFLNACQSYRQAMNLVKGGAIGGIATLSDVTDDQAAVVGRTAARLLNLGFPLRMALEVARSRSVVGGQYLTVGDGAVTLVPPDGAANRLFITSAGENFELKISTYQSSRESAGSLYLPRISAVSERYLVGKTIGPFDLSGAELREFLEYTNVPVEFDGEFRWAFDLADELA
jgi:hypothetical protein